MRTRGSAMLPLLLLLRSISDGRSASDGQGRTFISQVMTVNGLISNHCYVRADKADHHHEAGSDLLHYFPIATSTPPAAFRSVV